MAQTYYELLGVTEDASTADITAAFREQIKQTHPDISDSPDAKTRAARLIEAKEVLTTPARRRRYDRFGHDSYVRVTGHETGANKRSHTSATNEQSAESSTADGHTSSASSTATTGQADDRTRGTAHQTATGQSRRSRAETSSQANATEHTHRSQRTNSHRQAASSTTRKTTADYGFDTTWAAVVAWITRSLLGVTLWFGSLLGILATTGNDLLRTQTSVTILLVSMCVSFLTYEACLERISTHARRPPRVPTALPTEFVWLAVVNLSGVGLYTVAIARGSNPITDLLAGIITVGAGALVFGSLLAIIGGLLGGLRGVFIGLGIGILLASVLLVTSWFGSPFTDLATYAGGHPWLAPVDIASIHVGLLGNLLLAVWMVIALGGSAVWFYLRFGVQPWRDRYERGYRVRPGVWQAGILLPWLVLGSTAAFGVTLPPIAGYNLRAVATIGTAAAPLIIGIPYYCRLAVERAVRNSQ